MFFSELTRTIKHCAIAISQLGFCVTVEWVFTTQSILHIYIKKI